MARMRLTSSGLSTGGSFCDSLMCQTSAARSWRRSVTRKEPHPGHDPVAVADACTALDEVRIGRAFEPCGEPLATVDVAALRVWVELARSHVFDHMLT